MKQQVNLIVVDDHPVVLQGFAHMLNGIPDFNLMGQFSDAEQALAFVTQHTTDVVLLDINLPGMGGIEACKHFIRVQPNIKLIAISNIDEYSIIKRMLDSGASGYLLKNCSAEELITCIHQVLSGATGLSESVRRLITKHQSEELPVVTHREQQVLQLLAEGLSSVEIGEKIFISPATVESHRRNLLKKFAVANVAALIYQASEMKYI